MEIGGRRVWKSKKIAAESTYPCTLQFYACPPTGFVSLMEFEEVATERLEILRIVERVYLSGHSWSLDECTSKLYDDFAKNKNFIHTADKTSTNKRDEAEAARRQDHVSHFILRLVYCRNEELRRWFIARETDLFRARFHHRSRNGGDIKRFLVENNLHFTPISEEELHEERENLISGTFNISCCSAVEDMLFYKVPFMEAYELVSARRVFLKGGWAYVPVTELVTLVTYVFRTRLSQSMASTGRALPQVRDDERLWELLEDFDKLYTGEIYGVKKGPDAPRITPDMIDQLAPKSFPPCMRQLHEKLRTTHHLKYGGRLMYGLFLKAAGLSLPDAIEFWKSHFLEHMDIDKFEKQYAYNIRFNYGKEGKRVDWLPHTCIKIITSNLGPGDAHGCPFKCSHPNGLRQQLINDKIPEQVIGDIIDLVSEKHYQIACQRYWETTHNAIIDVGINHPNQFFEESLKHLHGPQQPNQGKKPTQVKGNRSVMYSSQSSTQSTKSADSIQSNQASADNNNPSSSLAVDSDMDDNELSLELMLQLIDAEEKS